jgi:Tfp pilus assembly protein PilO
MADTKSSPTIRRTRESVSTKTYTFIGVTLITVIFFLVGAIKPTLSAISRIKNEVEEKEIVDAQLQDKINTLTELQNSVSEYQDELEILNTYFPSNSDYSLLMAGFERITSNWGFQMDSLSIKVDETENISVSDYPGMDLVEVKLVANGPKSQVTELVEHIENTPVIPQVVKLSYALDESYRTGFVSLSLIMNIYKMN